MAIPLLVHTHDDHAAVRSWAAGRRLPLAGHAVTETYAVLTRLPGDLRVEPARAVELMTDWFAPPLLLPARSMRRVPRSLAELDISGGAAYDALVALAAKESGAVLATRDERARQTYELVGTRIEIVA